MKVETHADRMARLHADVDAECARRIEKRLAPILEGKPFRPDDYRFAFDAAGVAYRASRAIETEARKHWHNLARVVGDCERFLAMTESAAGAHVAAQLADAVPRIADIIRRAPSSAVTAGESAFSERPPSRRTFIQEKLDGMAVALGVDDPFAIDPQLIATLTIFSGSFWPYARAAEKRFEKDGYPTASEVLRKESEQVRKFLKR